MTSKGFIMTSSLVKVPRSPPAPARLIYSCMDCGASSHAGRSTRFIVALYAARRTMPSRIAFPQISR